MINDTNSRISAFSQFVQSHCHLDAEASASLNSVIVNKMYVKGDKIVNEGTYFLGETGLVKTLFTTNSREFIMCLFYE